MSRIIISAILILAVIPSFSQKKILHLAEIPGYQTLVCDFHMHTVFSDGSVWPTVRLDEAEKRGLDVIAITDHIEYQPHKEYIPTDHNAAWKIASEEGLKRGILVVQGCEITRRMPPGHFNVLFIEDANKLTDEDFMTVIGEAIAQDAFIQWNHPGWKGQRPDGIPRMDSIHHVLISNGWIHGIEIYNYSEFYPDVMDWCLEYNLTMIGNSDIHSPLGEENMSGKIPHPPITLVFAKSASEEDIKEALKAGRTLVWFGDTLAGRHDLAEEFVLNSLEIGPVFHSDAAYTYRFITNRTDIPYSVSAGYDMEKDPIRLSLPAGHASRFRLPQDAGDKLRVKFENVLAGNGKTLETELNLSDE